MMDVGVCGEECGLFGPGVDDGGDIGNLHPGEGEAVVRVEAEHTAAAAFALGDEQRRGLGEAGRGSIRQESGEVVIEDKDRFVVGILLAAGAGVSRAEIAGGIVVELGGRGWGRAFALPGTLGSLRRDKHPLVEQRIEPTVRSEQQSVSRQGEQPIVGSQDDVTARL